MATADPSCSIRSLQHFRQARYAQHTHRYYFFFDGLAARKALKGCTQRDRLHPGTLNFYRHIAPRIPRFMKDP
jgi:hypothetical protein